ncbi:MAG: hypothetical protein IPK07_22780 [Deltaproteobacteria bacterium]|nr:hypothetical protein [Deltaproteobacteria bacterium]
MLDRTTSTMKPRHRALAALLGALLVTLAVASGADAKMFKWIDPTGKLSVGTSPPPKDYEWVDDKGIFYNRPVVDGRELIFIGTAPDKKVETRGPLKRSRGFGAGNKASWESSSLRSPEPVQVGLGDQFLPTVSTGPVVVGLTANVQKGSDCLSVELDNRGDTALTDVRAAFALYTSNVYIGQRVITVADLPKGTKSTQICEGQGKVSFADGVALDHMTWKVGGAQKSWP